MIRVGQRRTDGELAVTIATQSPLGVYLAEAPGFRLWGSASLLADLWPTVLREPEATPADEGPALLAEAREREATS